MNYAGVNKMKKLILTISIMFMLFFTGCYKEDTATVRISFSNLPVAQIQQKSVMDRIRSFFVKDAYAATADELHIAAVKGNKLLAVINFNKSDVSDNTVEMEVPAGDDILIVVLYYYFSVTGGSGYRYGNANVNLVAGKESDVSISVATLLGNTLNFIYNNNNESCTWNAIPGATKYILEGFSDSTGLWYNYPGYDGHDTNLTVNGYVDYQLRVYFDYFNVTCGPY